MSWEGTEKRNFKRVYLSCRIIVYAPKEYAIDTVTNNISEGGVGFTLKEKLEVFSIVGLEIYNVTNRPIICKGMIRWINEVESSFHRGRFLFNTGIQFHEIKPKDKLAIINLIAAIPSEQK